MKPSVRYGLILGVTLAAIPLLSYVLGIDKNETLQTVSGFLNVAVTAVIIFLGIRELRTMQNGYLAFGKGFSAGITISLIGGCISALFSYLYFTVINPGMMTYIKMKQEEEMLKRGMSDADIEQMAGTMEFWTSPGMMAGFALLGMLLIGLVISLICAGILKKEDPMEQIS